MFTINAEVRKEQGKGERCLRAANKFPAIIYGGKKALAIELITTKS